MTPAPGALTAPGPTAVTVAAAVLCLLPQAIGATIVGPGWPPPIGLAPALGLAVALVTVWGPRALVGVIAGLFGGALLARDAVSDPASVAQTLLWAASAAAGAAAAGLALRRRGRAPLSSLSATTSFLLIGVAGAAVAPALASAPLAGDGRLAEVLILEFARMATGVLVFAPLGLAALQALPEHGQLPRLPILAFYLIGGALLLAAFGLPPESIHWSGLAAALVLPLMLWAGARLPASVAISGNAAVAVVAAGAATQGAGPFRFPEVALLQPPHGAAWDSLATGIGPLPGIFAYAAAVSVITLMAAGIGAELVAARRTGKRRDDLCDTGMARLRALLDTAPVPVGLLRRDGTLVYANQDCAATLGCEGRDISGADFNRFVADPAEREAMLAAFDRHGQLDGHAYRLRRADGAVRWIEESWARVSVDGQNYILAWSADITERKLAEEQLRSSERRLRSILDESPVAVVISRPGGRILYANPRAAGLVGLPRALLIGADGREFYADPTQRQRLSTVMRSGGAVVNEEADLRAADGQRRTCLFSLLPMEFDAAPARLAWSFDITFRKRAEEELRKSEARLRSILAASPLSMAVIDHRGRLRYANGALLDQFALEEHEVVGLRATKLVATPIEAKALRHRLLKKRQTLRGVEAELRRSDGSTFWGLLSFELGIFEGEPSLFAWAADITERKEAERALTAHRDFLERAVEMSSQAQQVLNQQLSRELEERKRVEARIRRSQTYLRTVLDTVADGIITIDSYGLIEDVNPAAERIFGHARDALIGRNVSLLMPEPDRGLHDEFIRRYLRGEGGGFVGRGREVRGLRADGTTFPLYLAISAAQVGERTVFTGVLRDITDQKRAESAMLEAKEAAEMANRTKSEFLANMSHELRTPLNAIIGFSEMIKSEILGPVGNANYLDYVGDIHASGRHLLDVINDILDIARIEAGRMTLYEESVNLGAVASACLKLVHPRADEVGLTLIGLVPDDLPPLWGDARRIKQMLLNLLSNAVKFTPHGGQVSLSIGVDAEGMVITVSDTGPGMSPQEARDALKPFVQVDSGLSRKFEGTGLGLPLVAAMAEMHGGSLILESARGEGTRAIIRFPASRLSAPDGGSAATTVEADA